MKALALAYICTWVFIPWILVARKRPVSTLAWVWAVVLFPFAGPAAYLLFGVDRITRPRRRQQTKARQGIPAGSGEFARLPEFKRPLFRALEKLSGYPASAVEDLRFLPGAACFYQALLKLIESAQQQVEVEFFVWEEDAYGGRLRDALVAAARRGVAVRVLVDRIGCLHTRRRFFRPLADAGGRFAWFRTLNPLRKHFSLHLRNHRKLQVIDSQIALVGGMNVGSVYAGENPRIGAWRDLQIELRGPIVAQLQQVFAEDWFFAAGEEMSIPKPAKREGVHAAQIVLGGPDLAIEAMAESIAALLQHASKRAWIATGYFIPDTLLLTALRIAALRGVDMRILGSEKSDHPYLAEIGRSYYPELLDAGVRIFEYQAGFHHAKAMLVDETLLMIGSANCDNRSMRLNFELNVLIDSPAGARELQDIFEHDFASSREITPGDLGARSFTRRMIQAIVRPLAPMT